MNRNIQIDSEKEKKLEITYYIAAISAIGLLIIDMKMRGEDFGLDTLLQIVFYLAILIVIKFIIFRIKKIKNLDTRKEAIKMTENFENMAESSLFHILSMIIAVTFAFMVFSLSYILLFFNKEFVMISIGVSAISFPIFYFLAYNGITFRRFYIKNKKSRPFFYPFVAAIIAFLGILPALVDVSDMIFLRKIPNEILGVIFMADIGLTAVICYKYFKLMQKIEITKQDIEKKTKEIYILKD